MLDAALTTGLKPPSHGAGRCDLSQIRVDRTDCTTEVVVRSLIAGVPTATLIDTAGVSDASPTRREFQPQLG